MEKYKLVEPTIEYKDAAIDYINELRAYKSDVDGVGSLQRYLSNYDEWLNYLDNKKRIVKSEKEVPSVTYFFIRESDNRIIGMSTIRLELNERLRKLGGNIGCSIRPTERSKGLCKINLYLCLLKCQEAGIDSILVDCNRENIASSKTIEALGGKLIKEYYESDYAECYVRDYIIDVDDSIDKYRCLYEQCIDDDKVRKL
jgi:predicted acetyltransferase